MSPEHPHPYHESLTLKNFTAFEEASFEFVPGINVFIGENGTGKTHVMKVLYAYILKRERYSLLPNLEGLFRTDASELKRGGSDTWSRAEMHFRYGGTRNERAVDASFYNGNQTTAMYGVDVTEPRPHADPVFIPAFDVIGSTQGMLSTFDRFYIDLDRTMRDLTVMLLSPGARKHPAHFDPILKTTGKILGGGLELEGERFYISDDFGRISMTLVAEGIRKIAVLQRLLEVGALEPGTTLFWDEPEVGLNPKLMDELVRALILLARSGVQIFLTTHSYVILKELDLQIAEDDPIRYFLFEPTESSGTKVTPFETLAEVHPNPILEQYNDLYDREITRKTGRKKAQ